MVDGYHVFYQGFLADPPPVWDEAWRTSEALVEEIRREVQAVDGTMLAVVSPMNFQLHHEGWQAIVGRYPAMERQEWDLLRPMRLADELFGRRGIPHLDLLGVLEEASQSGDRMYFEHDPHWNVLGNRVAGRAVGRFLAAHLAEGATERITPASEGPAARGTD
jgi:hypothetical protein